MKSFKRWLVVAIVILVVAAASIVFFAVNKRDPLPVVVMPNPNGYDDFVAASQWVVTWGNSNLLTLPPEEIRTVLAQNSKALEEVRRGLQKESAVPVIPDLNLMNAHFASLGPRKSLAQLLAAEGVVHLSEGRTNEAARSFMECIRFAHAANRHGLMIDELVGMACQAIGAQRLASVAAHLSPEVRREILAELIALEQARESAATMLQRERAWSRGAYGWVRVTWARIATRKVMMETENRFIKQHTRSVAALRLVMADLAVRGYQSRHGKLPATLSDLVPDWLPTVPIDPYNNQSLAYRTTNDSILLYSIGPDQKDDGGTPIKKGGLENGDLLPTGF